MTGQVTVEPFTKQMRDATREAHALSDALVNAKLVFAASDNQVWAEGLLVFYEVFRYLEDAMNRWPQTYLGNLRIEGIRRTEAFKNDLDFYTPDWASNYEPRESVTNYLLHLRRIENEDPHLLIAYIYHLYMGLLSGGQILKKKRELFGMVLQYGPQGDAVTSFGEMRISKIKRDLVARVNSIAAQLDDNTKLKLINESKNVFILNNDMIKSVRGTSRVILKKTLLLIAVMILIVAVYYRMFKL